MYNDNQVTETIKGYEAIYVISENDLREFQTGHISLLDLFARRFRVPCLFKGIDTPATTANIGGPTFR